MAARDSGKNLLANRPLPRLSTRYTRPLPTSSHMRGEVPLQRAAEPAAQRAFGGTRNGQIGAAL